jgi:hypothetical protein
MLEVIVRPARSTPPSRTAQPKSAILIVPESCCCCRASSQRMLAGWVEEISGDEISKRVVVSRTTGEAK